MLSDEGHLVGGFGQILLGAVVTLGGPILYSVLQVRALWRWDGWWRIAALAPLLMMTAAVVIMVAGLRAGSNLAPLAVIFSAPVAIVWLGFFWGIRRYVLP